MGTSTAGILSHVLTPLEVASLSPESKTKLVEALVRAYCQGALDQHAALALCGQPPASLCREDERDIERAAKARFAEGTLGREEGVPF